MRLIPLIPRSERREISRIPQHEMQMNVIAWGKNRGMPLPL